MRAHDEPSVAETRSFGALDAVTDSTQGDCCSGKQGKVREFKMVWEIDKVRENGKTLFASGSSSLGYAVVCDK